MTKEPDKITNQWVFLLFNSKWKIITQTTAHNTHSFFQWNKRLFLKRVSYPTRRNNKKQICAKKKQLRIVHDLHTNWMFFFFKACTQSTRTPYLTCIYFKAISSNICYHCCTSNDNRLIKSNHNFIISFGTFCLDLFFYVTSRYCVCETKIYLLFRIYFFFLFYMMKNGKMLHFIHPFVTTNGPCFLFSANQFL